MESRELTGRELPYFPVARKRRRMRAWLSR